jgi:hypothetical protein
MTAKIYGKINHAEEIIKGNQSISEKSQEI